MKRMNAYELTRNFIVGNREKQTARTEVMPIYKACVWLERSQSSLEIIPVVDGNILWDAKVQEEHHCEKCQSYFLVSIEELEECYACPNCGEVDRVYPHQTIVEMEESA